MTSKQRCNISHCYSAYAWYKLKVIMLALPNKKGLTGGTMKALDVANYFVELAGKTSEHDLTNLKLQKLLYYVQGKYLAINHRPFFADNIEAWKYGPVVNDVYHAFKQCGNYPVTAFDVNFTAHELSEESKGFVEKIWDSIGKKYSGNYLVTRTHANGTPWKKLYNDSNRNIVIPNTELESYFSTHNM